MVGRREETFNRDIKLNKKLGIMNADSNLTMSKFFREVGAGSLMTDFDSAIIDLNNLCIPDNPEFKSSKWIVDNANRNMNDFNRLDLMLTESQKRIFAENSKMLRIPFKVIYYNSDYTKFLEVILDKFTFKAKSKRLLSLEQLVSIPKGHYRVAMWAPYRFFGTTPRTVSLFNTRTNIDEEIDPIVAQAFTTMARGLGVAWYDIVYVMDLTEFYVRKYIGTDIYYKDLEFEDWECLTNEDMIIFIVRHGL